MNRALNSFHVFNFKQWRLKTFTNLGNNCSIPGFFQKFLSLKKNFFFLFGCAGSSLLRSGFLKLWQVGAICQLQCDGFSLQWLLLFPSTASKGMRVLAVAAHRLSCPMACGIFLDQRSNSGSFHWQADSQPLDHQGSPAKFKF